MKGLHNLKKKTPSCAAPRGGRFFATQCAKMARGGDSGAGRRAGRAPGASQQPVRASADAR